MQLCPWGSTGKGLAGLDEAPSGAARRVKHEAGLLGRGAIRAGNDDGGSSNSRRERRRRRRRRQECAAAAEAEADAAILFGPVAFGRRSLIQRDGSADEAAQGRSGRFPGHR